VEEREELEVLAVVCGRRDGGYAHAALLDEEDDEEEDALSRRGIFAL
jgi:hypothetical protein